MPLANVPEARWKDARMLMVVSGRWPDALRMARSDSIERAPFAAGDIGSDRYRRMLELGVREGRQPDGVGYTTMHGPSGRTVALRPTFPALQERPQDVMRFLPWVLARWIGEDRSGKAASLVRRDETSATYDVAELGVEITLTRAPDQSWDLTFIGRLNSSSEVTSWIRYSDFREVGSPPRRVAFRRDVFLPSAPANYGGVEMPPTPENRTDILLSATLAASCADSQFVESLENAKVSTPVGSALEDSRRLREQLADPRTFGLPPKPTSAGWDWWWWVLMAVGAALVGGGVVIAIRRRG